MRRKIAPILIISGFLFAGWNGYFWIAGTSSGKETIGKNDIIATAQEETLAEKNNESLSLAGEPEAKSPVVIKNTERSEEPEPRDYEEYEKGAEIGWLLIPELDMKYPIYWGTDDDTLNQGVGYHIGNFTTPPDGLRHTVLSGHRDTVFQELGELKAGSKMYIQFEDVQYEYQIEKTWITDAQDRTVIVEKDAPTLTLTTCYPFTFIGSAPDRYIIEAPLIAKTPMN